MGKYRFRLSDMMPNSWLYKLKGISRTRKHNPFHSPNKKQSSEISASRKLHDSHPRYRPHNFTRDLAGVNRFPSSPVDPKALDARFPDISPGKSSNKKRSRRKTIYRPSPRLKLSSHVSATCRCHASVCSSRTNNRSSLVNPEPSDDSFSSGGSFSESPLSETDGGGGFTPPAKTFADGQTSRLESRDIVIDMNNDPYTRKLEEVDAGFDLISEEEEEEEEEVLRSSTEQEEIGQTSIQVKDFKKCSLSAETQRVQQPIPVGRKSSSSPSGIRLRMNSPKIARKKTQASARRKSASSSNTRSGFESRNKGISDSYAIVMSSIDPEKDFRQSMMEMIVEKNIRESKDLEDLLACYLSLNSSEFHDTIIKAFEQTWFDMTNLRL